MNGRFSFTRVWFGLATAISLTLTVLSSANAQAPAQMLYVTDFGDNTVKRINPEGVVSTFISTGLNSPCGLVFDPQGNLYVSNAGGNSISKYNSAGVQQPFALSGESLLNPFAVQRDAAGDLLVVNFAANGIDNIISKITSAGVVSTFAAEPGVGGAFDLVQDGFGNLYTEDINNNGISVYDSAGVWHPFALTGESLALPSGLSRDALGNLFVGNLDSNTISKITETGVVSTFVAGDGLNGPGDTELDGLGNLFVINAFDSTITKYDSTGAQLPFTLSGESLLFPALMAFGPSVVAVPEPGSLTLLAIVGLPLAGVVLRRRRSA